MYKKQNTKIFGKTMHANDPNLLTIGTKNRLSYIRLEVQGPSGPQLLV